MKAVTFSVVTPCFNSELYIAETIESVLSQTGPFRIQYIIVDGGSTDSTLDIINFYRKKLSDGHYARNCLEIDFQCISERDNGMYDAIAKGLRLATGDICSYINSDDFYLNNAFKTALSIFSFYSSVNWLTGIPNVYNFFGANFKRNIPFEYRQDFIRKGVYGRDLSHIQQESVFWRTGLLQQVNLEKFSKLKLAGDYYLWHEFSKNNKLYIVDSIISGFRTHAGNKSKDIERYNDEFNSLVSEKMSLRDRFDLRRHKKLWLASYDIKRKLSNTIFSVVRPQLMEHYKKIEACSTEATINPEAYDQTPEHAPLLSVVIGSFNRLPMLRLCIQALREELVGKNIELIVVDGGSSDGTIEWLISQKDVITILQHNRGEWQGEKIKRKPWSYFMNLGFKAASGKFVCMLSDDSLIIPGAINNGLELFEKKLSEKIKLGAVAFYFRDFPIRKEYAVAINVGNLYVNHGLYLKRALDEAGYADENYHFYFADTDLILKIKSKGYECIASRTSFVEHYFEATPEIRASNNDNKKEQDRQRLINKWRGKAYPDTDYEKYLKTVGYWDYHPDGFIDESNTIEKLIKAAHEN